MRATKSMWLAVLLIAAALAGCRPTLNVGSGPHPVEHFLGPITVPTGRFATESGEFSVSWSVGQSPFTTTWNFGGGAEPNSIGPIAATSPDAQTVLFTDEAGGTFTVSVTVTDSLGQTGSASTTYTYGPKPNQVPVLSVLAGDGTSLIVIHAEDADGDPIEVSVTEPAGLHTAETSGTILGGSGELEFRFGANDLFAGAEGDASFVGNDGTDDSLPVTAHVEVCGISSPADTLFAVPLQDEAAAGETVTIVVATAVPANPFRFLNGCRVTAPTGFKYVDSTFNIGLPGGAAGDIDGFWTGMNPSGGFLLPPDDFIRETDLGGGLTGIDFNVTPLGGSDCTTCSGALFNFGATFAPGINVLGFQQIQGVDRTYYTDGNTAPVRYWGDITNNHASSPCGPENTVVVVE